MFQQFGGDVLRGPQMSKGFSQVTKNATISMLTGGGEGDVCSILNKRNRAVITSPSTPPPTAAEWSAADSVDNEPLSKVLRLAPGQLPPPSPSIPIGVGAVAKPKPASPVKAARIAIPDPPMSAKERQAHEAQKRKDDRARELQKKKDEATKRKEAQASVRAARTMNS